MGKVCVKPETTATILHGMRRRVKNNTTHLVVNDYELIDQSCSCYLFGGVSMKKVVKVMVVDVVLLQP